MNNTVKLTESGNPASQVREILFELQLRVARRSDALAQACTGSRACDRKLWLRAEQEIFETVDWTDVHSESGRGAVPAANLGCEPIDSPRAITAGCERPVGARANSESENLEAPPSDRHECDRLVTRR